MFSNMNMDNILKYASACYDFDINNIESISSGANKVYKIQKNKQFYYLRISERGFDYISAQIDWIEYLKSGIRVPEPVLSCNGKLIECFQDNNINFTICLFSELKGVKWKKSVPCFYNDETYYYWGKVMGRMHCMTKNYRPSEGILSLPRFEENYNHLSNYRVLPLVQKKMMHIQSEISALPQDKDSYGLIHCDMQQQNILIDGNDIGVLDFDSQYGFFALDIGIALYHAIWFDLPDSDDRNIFARKIIKQFMSGYNTENSLSDFWLNKIILFMQYRQIEAFSWHIGVFKSNGFTAVVYNEWLGIYFDFKQYIKNMENGVFLKDAILMKRIFTLQYRGYIHHQQSFTEPNRG